MGFTYLQPHSGLPKCSHRLKSLSVLLSLEVVSHASRCWMALLTQLIEPLQVKVPRVDYIVLERSFALHVSLALIVSALQCQLYTCSEVH